MGVWGVSVGEGVRAAPRQRAGSARGGRARGARARYGLFCARPAEPARVLCAGERTRASCRALRERPISAMGLRGMTAAERETGVLEVRARSRRRAGRPHVRATGARKRHRAHGRDDVHDDGSAAFRADGPGGGAVLPHDRATKALVLYSRPTTVREHATRTSTINLPGPLAVLRSQNTR